MKRTGFQAHLKALRRHSKRDRAGTSLADGRSRACFRCDPDHFCKSAATLFEFSPSNVGLSELNFGTFVICGLACGVEWGTRVRSLVVGVSDDGISSGSLRISAAKNCKSLKDTDLISI